MSKPAILLVGGAYHTAAYLAPLAKPFQEDGYVTRAVGLPSAGANPPAKDFSGDVAAIRKAACELFAEQKDVIVVLHSLGGIPGSNALEGLAKASPERPGVIAVAYIAAIVPIKGRSVDDHYEAIGLGHMKAYRDSVTHDGVFMPPAERMQKIMYGDIDEAEAKRWMSLLVHQSAAPYHQSPLTYEAWKEIPSGYLFTANDQAITPEIQHKTVELAGFRKDRNGSVETGHTPWFTKPDEVKRYVLSIADL